MECLVHSPYHNIISVWFIHLNLKFDDIPFSAPAAHTYHQALL